MKILESLYSICYFSTNIFGNREIALETVEILPKVSPKVSPKYRENF